MKDDDTKVEKEITLYLNISKLKQQVSEVKKTTDDFSNSVKENIGMTHKEFIELRKNLKEMGVDIDAIRKMNEQVQKGYREELKKTKEEQKKIKNEGKAEEARIEAEYQEKINKLSEKDRKKKMKEYKELLDERKQALDNHKAEMALKLNKSGKEIKNKQEEMQELSLDSIRDYYGKIGHIAHNGLTKATESTKLALDKINQFLPVNDPKKEVQSVEKPAEEKPNDNKTKPADTTPKAGDSLAKTAKESANRVKENSWTKGLKDITAEYKLGLDQMTKYYDDKQEQITNKYKKKRAELEKQANELKKPNKTVKDNENKIKDSKKKIDTMKDELELINKNSSEWDMAKIRERDRKDAEAQATPSPTPGNGNTNGNSGTTTPKDPKENETPKDPKENETPKDPKEEEKPKELTDEEKKQRAKQMAERKEYLEAKLALEQEHYNGLVKATEDSQKKIDELNKKGFKTEQDIAAEVEKLNKQELEEKAKIDKKKEKLKKQQQKIAYIEGIKEKAVGIINAISSTSEGAAKALAKGPILGPILAAMITAKGALEVRILSTQLARYKATAAPQQAERGGLLQGRRHRDGGMRIEGTNIEVEGGEYVINRRSTARNLGLLEYINANDRPLNPTELMEAISNNNATQTHIRHHLEDGGQVLQVESLTQNNNEQLLEAIRQIKLDSRVAVTDIISAQDNYTRVEKWVGF